MGDSINILDEEYISSLQIIEDIHKSEKSTIYKVSKPDGTILALKVLKESNIQTIRGFMSQYEMMAMLHHPNILKVYGIFFGSEKKAPYFLMEYCPTSIEKEIIHKTLTKVDISFAIYQISVAMKYIHKKQILYRDLKPSNILIGQDSLIKISNFSVSELFSPDNDYAYGVGTMRFMAPEVISEDSKIDEKSDVYSFGVTLFYLLNEGNLPHFSVQDFMAGRKAKIPDNFTNLSREIIDLCWNHNPEDRPSFKDICQKIEKAHFGLFDLNNSEQAQISEMINSYKQKFF